MKIETSISINKKWIHEILNSTLRNVSIKDINADCYDNRIIDSTLIL